jgi:hypothetical protein
MKTVHTFAPDVNSIPAARRFVLAAIGSSAAKQRDVLGEQAVAAGGQLRGGIDEMVLSLYAEGRRGGRRVLDERADRPEGPARRSLERLAAGHCADVIC